jgi:hypothetical protein
MENMEIFGAVLITLSVNSLRNPNPSPAVDIFVLMAYNEAS